MSREDVGGEDGAPSDPWLAEGTRVGGFCIQGVLGEGAMGQVYLAQDMALGRRVALKLIKRSIMQAEAPSSTAPNDNIAPSDAVARFLEEARATASFNHPHIVTIHAVGEHEGRPYLALEHLDGESLRARLAAGPWPVPAALRCARAVAEAIAEAHRRGIVHADLKPENVVLPADGRVRVVDFGLARLAGTASANASGTPLYMAPERWRGAPPTGAIDVWAFGILLHELATGRRPFTDAAAMRLPLSSAPIQLPDLVAAPWADLVRACLTRDPAARPSADELVRRLGALLDPRAAAAADAGGPFPGLAAFSREQAAHYFGRRAELDALVEQLRARPLIPIVGPSGIGKSSFVRAALLPRLDEAERWIALAVRPGAQPFDSLAAQLALPGRPAAQLAASLRQHPESLSLALGEAAAHHRARVLLFIDQFEETFTLAADPATATAFCDALARAAFAAAPWRIVLTLRDDFLGRLAAAPAMRPHLGAVALLAPLSAADLREAVAGPLANAGYAPDSPALVERIVRDVAGQPACLPLLQFACRALWERRDPAGRRLLTAEYEAMGGASGALASHAQRCLAELPPEEVRLVRGLLLALVHPDGTRRPRRRAELVEGVPAASREVAGRLLDRLLERRLLAAARGDEREADPGAATLEVAHEALATAWPELARWLDETYEERVLVADLEQAALRWQRRRRDDAEAWSGAALAEAARKVESWSIALSPLARAFLDASVSRERHLQRRRRRIAAGAVIGLGAVALGAAVTAFAFAAKSDQLNLAAADLGRIRLELRPFDWDPATQRARPPQQRPPLEWRLRGTSPEDPHEPGRPYDERSLRRGAPAWRGGALVEDVEVRSGPAFLEVRRGAGCAPSLIYLQRLPGYAERAESLRVEIAVPTCEATRAGMVHIAEGVFLRAAKDDNQLGRDVEASLPAYWIDKTEVTRGAFEVFHRMRALTGAPYVDTQIAVPDTAAPEHLPASGIKYALARSYCRYLGKELPTSDQWQKAFRGGLMVNGQPNPAPARTTPWDGPTVPGTTNIDNARNELARVGHHPRDASPYGILDLAGNVREWSLETSTNMPGMRRVHGGGWDSPARAGHEQIFFTIARAEEYLDYALGMRCVISDRGREN